MAFVLINNQGPFRGWLQAATEGASRTTVRAPDPTWWTTDRRGHYHAYGIGWTLPTLYLVGEQLPEGDKAREYRCRMCREPVSPHRNTFEVLSDATLCLTGVPVTLADCWIGREVSFMDDETFGVARYGKANDNGLTDKVDVEFRVILMGQRIVPGTALYA